MKDLIRERIAESIRTKQDLLSNESLIDRIQQAADTCIRAFRAGNKVLLCGNGGSAADAQHIAAELSGRFKKDREPLFAEALHVNTSFVTAVANDYGYDEIYARAVRGMGRKGDVLFALSTSGNSQNVLKAAEAAKRIGMTVIGLTGSGGGKLSGTCDNLLAVPSDDTARIQEMHILIGHILCEIVESELF